MPINLGKPVHEWLWDTDFKGKVKLRCRWCASAPEFLHYHDEEWGFPEADNFRLFEKLCLEGFQSGLSWRTILAKRENFRTAVRGFDYHQVARFTEKDVARLLLDAGIVRHRGKIEAVINNAQRAVDLARQEGSLAAYLWQFEPKPDHGAAPQTASTSAESVALSKALKQQGWKFVGPTTVYGENDPFYSLAHSRANFDAFQAAGGTGSFAPFMVPGEDQGHSLLAHPRLWTGHLDRYLDTLA